MYTTTPYGEKIIISSSIIRALYHNGNEKIVCPQRFYEETLIHNVDRKPRPDRTNPLAHGIYFETHCLGGGRLGQQRLDLERKAVSKKAMEEWNKKRVLAEQQGLPIPEMPKGLKLTYHERIDHQINQFKLKHREYNMKIIPDMNTQIRIYKNHPDPDMSHVLLRGDIDWLTNLTLPRPHDRTKMHENVALIDLKLTADVNNEHDFNGAVPWGKPERLDPTQLILYNELVHDIDYKLNEDLYTTLDGMEKGSSDKLKMLFESIKNNIINEGNLLLLYWVFDYQKPEQNNRIIDVNPTQNRRKELYEAIRKTVRRIEEMRDDGFPTNPIDSICKDCGVQNCKEKSVYTSI